MAAVQQWRSVVALVWRRTSCHSFWSLRSLSTRRLDAHGYKANMSRNTLTWQQGRATYRRTRFSPFRPHGYTRYTLLHAHCATYTSSGAVALNALFVYSYSGGLNPPLSTHHWWIQQVVVYSEWIDSSRPEKVKWQGISSPWGRSTERRLLLVTVVVIEPRHFQERGSRGAISSAASVLRSVRLLPQWRRSALLISCFTKDSPPISHSTWFGIRGITVSHCHAISLSMFLHRTLFSAHPDHAF